jgi:hypothetical protein
VHLLKPARRIAGIVLASLIIVLTVGVIAEVLGWALPLAKAE